MTLTRRRSALIGAALTTSLILAGCGADEGGGGGTEGSGEQASGDPVEGGSLTYLAVTEPANLDPASLSNSLVTQSVYGNALYGQLLEITPGGEVEYGLIENLENRDGTTWIVTLREGLTFTDGTPLDAEALKYNWDRAKDRTVAGSQTVASAAAIAGTTVVDDRTLEVTLAKPTAQFASLIMAINFVGSPTALAEGPEAFTADPVGAGPFTLDSWTRQDRMVLSANPDYWDAPRPYLDELVIRANPDDNQRYNSLQAGEVDVAISNNYETVQLAGDAGMTTLPAGFSGFTNLMFNFSTAPFDDPRAREAITLAIDRQALVDTLYGGAGEEPPTSLIRETSALYDDSASFPESDAERAQELLDELAAEGRPLEFTILSSNNSDVARAGEIMQAQLQEFDNLTVSIEAQESASWFGRLSQNDYDATIYGAAYVDPSPVLDTLVGTGSATNFNRISDPALDAALERGRLSDDPDERREAYLEVQQVLVDQSAMIVYTWSPAFLITSEGVGGIRFYGSGSTPVDGLWLVSDA
ncbi:ABC transporter substrate-binding protein [Trujillonella endophytica]|uniref:Peptide/nickel transport system substrate-binding protein n=1 Tax=Trujillonella endophytica TaxID=673521 RepID=A0A1H8UW51_9ACTN|nr:ABC transporter substrate-binding protein [Trujillella endophytica]SEP07405.1 peptide/nickel transport system substrate-binding protein [Trujillella endophytica]